MSVPIQHVFKISTLRQWNGCINDALFQCCVKSVAATVAIYCAEMMSHGAVDTQKRQLSSNMNLSNRNTS